MEQAEGEKVAPRPSDADLTEPPNKPRMTKGDAYTIRGNHHGDVIDGDQPADPTQERIDWPQVEGPTGSPRRNLSQLNGASIQPNAWRFNCVTRYRPVSEREREFFLLDLLRTHDYRDIMRPIPSF